MTNLCQVRLFEGWPRCRLLIVGMLSLAQGKLYLGSLVTVASKRMKSVAYTSLAPAA